MQKVVAVFLIVNGLLFAVLGAITLFDLSTIVAYLGLGDVNLSVNATNDLRANYGGLYTALGGLLIWSGCKPAWRATALLWLAVLFVGVVLGRVIDIAKYGMPDPQVVQFLVMEVVVILGALGLWWKIK